MTKHALSLLALGILGALLVGCQEEPATYNSGSEISSPSMGDGMTAASSDTHVAVSVKPSWAEHHPELERFFGLVGKDANDLADVIGRPTESSRFCIGPDGVRYLIYDWFMPDDGSGRKLIMVDKPMTCYVAVNPNTGKIVAISVEASLHTNWLPNVAEILSFYGVGEDEASFKVNQQNGLGTRLNCEAIVNERMLMVRSLYNGDALSVQEEMDYATNTMTTTKARSPSFSAANGKSNWVYLGPTDFDPFGNGRRKPSISGEPLPD